MPFIKFAGVTNLLRAFLHSPDQKLQHLNEGSAERPLYEKGIRALQRRSGHMSLIPDDFVITSLDVIIHKHEKLGEGRFAQVFRGDWQGATVAVKVFEKGIPQPVRAVMAH